jgi:hypothetical protein
MPFQNFAEFHEKFRGNFRENLKSLLTSSQMITPNVQVYAIIQPDVMIWLEDKN